MGLITAIRTWTTGTPDATDENRRARCRNCGLYYDAADELCPHCGSGNKLRGGLPNGQTRR